MHSIYHVSLLLCFDSRSLRCLSLPPLSLALSPYPSLFLFSYLSLSFSFSVFPKSLTEPDTGCLLSSDSRVVLGGCVVEYYSSAHFVCIAHILIPSTSFSI